MKNSCKFIIERRKKDGVLITDNVPIFADITYSGERIRYFTGFRINAEKWDTEKQQAKKNALAIKGNKNVRYNEINATLIEIRGKVAAILNNLSHAPDKKVIIDSLNNTTFKAVKITESDMEAPFNKYISTVPLSKTRISHLKVTFKKLKTFSKSKRLVLSFEKWSADNLYAFEKYLREDIITRKNGDKLTLGNNTVSANMKRLRAFFRWAKKNNFTDKNPFEKYEVPSEIYGNPIFLTRDERDFLYSYKITGHLEHVRDIFIFQCYVGCRVDDLFKLTKDNFQNNTLVYIPQKTSSERIETVSIPLSEHAKEILFKYRNEETILPFISAQKYNDYLKILFKTVGLNRIVTRINPRTSKVEHIPLYEIVTSHMARRTFIGLLYKKVKDDVIGSMSGHIKGSKAFTRYYDIDEEMKQEAISILN